MPRPYNSLLYLPDCSRGCPLRVNHSFSQTECGFQKSLIFKICVIIALHNLTIAAVKFCFLKTLLIGNFGSSLQISQNSFNFQMLSMYGLQRSHFGSFAEFWLIYHDT